MQQDNKHTDRKLQELENQSLPELSRMDEHWQQMKTMLQPGVVPATSKNGSAGRNLRWTVAAVLIGGLGLVTYKLLTRGKTDITTTAKTNNQPIFNNKTPINTLPAIKIINGEDTILFKAKRIHLPPSSKVLKVSNADGKDTDLQIMPADNPIDQSPMGEKANLDKFFKQLEKQTQEFFINNNRDTVINGEAGTALLIPANSFGSKGEVVITMKEFYSYEDIITNKLTTSSNGEQLITGGMIHLMATVDGKQVNIQPGKSIRWFVPDTSSSLNQMQLFTGETSNTRRQQKFWNREGQTGFYDNVSDTTGGMGSIETMNWIPDNRTFVSTYIVISVKVLDLSNEPFKTRYTRKGVTGLFHISSKPKISREELEAELKERYGYNKVRFKKYKSDNSLFLGMFRRNRHWQSYADVGDSTWMSDKIALKYKLKATDTVTYIQNSIVSGGGSYVKKTFSNINLNALANRFSVDIRNLGWINCDKFYNDKSSTLDYYVDLKDSAINYYTVLVFDKIRSMVRGQASGNKVHFRGVPKGQSAKVICVGIQNGKTVAAMQELPSAGTAITNLKFEETNPTSFREQTAILDN